jgi:hypothetical protein
MFMHPEIARAFVARHHDELARDTTEARQAGRRLLPRWRVSWTRTVLVPATAPGAQVGRTGRGGRGSSLVIIISARRSA